LMQEVAGFGHNARPFLGLGCVKTVHPGVRRL
jgi:hypothetical protein